MALLLKEIPEGAVKCKYEAELYKLKKKKRIAKEDNLEMREGMRYLLWSRYARGYYERRLDSVKTTSDILAYYILQGWIWLWPTDEFKDEIRADVKKSGRKYYELMKLRQTELDQERHERTGHKGNAFQWITENYKQRLKQMRG